MRNFINFSTALICLLAPAANAAILTVQASSLDTYLNPGTTLNANLVFDTVANSVSGAVQLNNVDPAKFGSSTLNFIATSIYLESFDPGYRTDNQYSNITYGSAKIDVGLTPEESGNLFPAPALSFYWAGSLFPHFASSGPGAGIVDSLEEFGTHYSHTSTDFLSLHTTYGDDSRSKIAFSDGSSNTQISWQVSQVPIPTSGLLFFCSLSGLVAKLRRKFN